MTAHTREPATFGGWFISEANPYEILDYNGGRGPYRLIAKALPRYLVTGTGTGEHSISSDEAEANARRIVACVNACAGISTEALEGDPLRNLLAALLTDHQTMEPHHAHLCPLCESVQVLLEEPKS